MTDNEIIKALECCYSMERGSCLNDCPYFNYTAKRSQAMIKDTLDLINRQQAEIEMLQNRLRHLLQSDFIASFDKLNRQKGNYNRDIKEADETIARARAEAIKEFAERLKKEFSQYQREYRKVLNSDGACAMIIAKKGIDNLAKEMG